MKPRSLFVRRTVDLAVKTAACGAAGLGITALGWILFEVISRGAPALNWRLVTRLPTPPGVSGGGMANALAGTALMTGLATLLAAPAGLMAGVYLAEWGKSTRLAAGVHFASNVLLSTPSIVVGVFVYALLVAPMGRFSGLAGAVALAIIMAPIVVRSAEDMLRLVPDELREAALALGAPRWRVIFGVLFRAAKRGLVTGVLLGIARVSGETAPLLFTALNSPYWPSSLTRPTASLSVTIFNYAMSPYREWQRQAWGASLLVMAGVLALTIVARVALPSYPGARR